MLACSRLQYLWYTQDADNLKKIKASAISKGIVESCSVLLFLNNETLDSEVRVHFLSLSLFVVTYFGFVCVRGKSGASMK